MFVLVKVDLRSGRYSGLTRSADHRMLTDFARILNRGAGSEWVLYRVLDLAEAELRVRAYEAAV